MIGNAFAHRKCDGKVRASMLALVFLAIVPSVAPACSICYGDPDSPVSQGLTWAILALATIVVAVLGAVVAFFVHASRKAASLASGTAAAAARIS